MIFGVQGLSLYSKQGGQTSDSPQLCEQFNCLSQLRLVFQSLLYHSLSVAAIYTCRRTFVALESVFEEVDADETKGDVAMAPLRRLQTHPIFPRKKSKTIHFCRYSRIVVDVPDDRVEKAIS